MDKSKMKRSAMYVLLFISKLKLFYCRRQHGTLQSRGMDQEESGIHHGGNSPQCPNWAETFGYYIVIMSKNTLLFLEAWIKTVRVQYIVQTVHMQQYTIYQVKKMKQ